MARDEDGQPMTAEEIRDELVTLVLAGHDTTTRALGWAAYFLHRPDYTHALACLRDEIDRTQGHAYLDAVCSEALRLNPVVNWMDRIVVQPFQLLEWWIPTGAIVAPCILLVHRRPDLYPEPLVFRPERFIERKFAPYEFLPFGGGARRCIGQALALLMMQQVLSVLIGSAQLAMEESNDVTPARRGASVGPSGELRMRLVGWRR